MSSPDSPRVTQPRRPRPEAPPTTGPGGPGPLTARPLDPAAHTAHLARHPLASFLQNPAWAAQKPAWRAESLGFFDGERLVGSALVLHRRLPLPRLTPLAGGRCLTYVAEGPVLDEPRRLPEALTALAAHARRRGAFLVRVGPPGVVRRWSPDAVRAGLKSADVHGLEDVEAETDPDELALQEQLLALGWEPPRATAEFDPGQPRFQARIPLGGLDFDGVLARMNQSSRRHTRRALAEELDVRVGEAADVAVFQRLYEDTAAREGFTPRHMDYFSTMLERLGASGLATVTLSTASAQGAPLAAALDVMQGHRAWYLYGASASGRDRRDAPRALQARRIQAALDAGARLYEFGGVSPVLERGHHLSGLIEFKTAMGAEVVETHGEWDLPVNKLLARAFRRALERRHG